MTGPTMDEQHIVRSPHPDITLPTGNFITHVFKNINKWHDKTALVCGDTLAELSYKELQQQVYKWCGFVKGHLHKGDVVIAIGPTCVEQCVVLLGTMAAGMVFVSIRIESTPDEIATQLKDCKPKMVIIHDTMEIKMKQYLELTQIPVLKVHFGALTVTEEYHLKNILADPTIDSSLPLELSGEETINLVYTSGTSGLPKSAVLSHNAVCANLAMFTVDMFCATKPTTETYQGCTFLHRTLAHIMGTFFILCVSLFKGMKIIVKTSNEATLLDDLEQHKITQFLCAPSLLKVLLRIPDERPSILEHWDNYLVGSSPVPAQLYKQFKDTMKGVKIQHVYGMTEVLLVTQDPVSDGQAGYTGQLVPNVLGKIVDIKTRKSLPINTIGELMIKSPAVISCYMNNPEATAAALTTDGWFYTGDIGEFNADGFLKIVDRIKEMIKVGQEPVYPSEIEHVLLQHPSIALACVIGVPHEELMEVPKAYVVVENDIVTSEEIVQYIARRLGKSKHLIGGVAILQELPKSSTGKIDRSAIKKMHFNS